MSECEDALICDFAETYHIYDYRGLPADYAATLCMGLRENSRVKMHLGGMRIPLEQVLLAKMTDELAFLSWSKTKDGQKNRNRPKSMVELLTTPPKLPENESFSSPEAFMAEWERIVRSCDG